MAIGDPIENTSFEVEPAEHGERLDLFLARRAAGLSRSRLKLLIQEGRVRVEGNRQLQPSHRLSAGDRVEIDIPEAAPAEPQPEAIPLRIFYEDEDLLVLDKPVGLVVHPAAGNWTGTLVNALIHHCGAGLSGVGGVRRPGIVHRLDKDTSGLMVVAKNDLAHAGLAAQFADHGRSGGLRREYTALVWGTPHPRAGQIDAPLDRDPRNRQKQAVARAGGRRAVTHYGVEERFAAGAVSSLRLQLETGRTHQIRVHMAHIGHPLLGDPTYGAGFLTKAATLPDDLARLVRALGRQALHAGLLGFAHPRTGEALEFSSGPPRDLAFLIERFRERTV